MEHVKAGTCARYANQSRCYMCLSPRVRSRATDTDIDTDTGPQTQTQRLKHVSGTHTDTGTGTHKIQIVSARFFFVESPATVFSGPLHIRNRYL
jgi:hypothetical protein